MAFRPIKIERHTKVGTAPLAFYTRALKKKRADGSVSTDRTFFYLRITKKLATRAGLSHRDAVRLDIDPHSKQGRLLGVQASSNHLSQSSGNWSLYVVFPYTGEVPTVFPIAAKTTGLTVLDSSVSEGLIFELPTP